MEIKIFTLFALFWFICLPNKIQAIGSVTIQESRAMDRVAIKQKIHHLIDVMTHKSIGHVLCGFDHKLSVMGIQGAVPLSHTSQNRNYLYRIEFDALIIDPRTHIDTNLRELVDLVKIGPAGRKVISPDFILGGYCLLDIPLADGTHRDPMMINTGMEYIWPGHGVAMWDVVFNPKYLFASHDKRFYKLSAKFGFSKPHVIDIFTATSYTKYPRFYPRWTWMMIGVKSQILITKWNINKFVVGGFGCIYAKNSKRTYFNLKNFKFSGYLQFNLLQLLPQSLIRDYLRMPIDRYGITPYYLDDNPKNYIFSTDMHNIKNPSKRIYRRY